MDGVRELKTACRLCAGSCALTVSIDPSGKLVQVRGDRTNPVTRGYACIKGLTLNEAHQSPDRLLHPLKRQADGTFARIPLEQAFDEIAAKIAQIVERDGADAVAGFRGTMSYSNLPANYMLPGFLWSMGSTSFYSTMTIDQSAKWVCFERLGGWMADRDHLANPITQVVMLVGTNPLVSLSTFNVNAQDPARSLKAAKARGVKVIVIDPRRNETAHHADLFLQPYPGEDSTLLAGLLRIILENGWHDPAFCAAHVEGLDALRAAVAPFTPDYVASRSGIAADDLHAAAALFTRDNKRGAAATGTGPNMGAHSNLAEHLVGVLNVVCGRFARAGEPVLNPGVIGGRRPRREQAIPPQRSWEKAPKSKARGHGLLFGERMTGALADEILTPVEGRIRALIVDAGNPVNAVPDQRKIVRAFRDLELLVTIDPFMTNTARLSHYIIPPRMMFERHELGSRDYESFIVPAPYAHYTSPIIDPPPGAEVCDDWYVLWALAQRLGVQIVFDGVSLNMTKTPTTEELIALICRHSDVPFEALQRGNEGRLYDIPPQSVEPAEAGNTARFAVMPADVAMELTALRAESVVVNRDYTHRLAVRRMRDVQNTTHRHLPTIQARHPFNPVWVHPDDLARRHLADGESVVIVSPYGRIEAIVEADDSMKPGVIAMSHGWGPLPDEDVAYARGGASTNLLLSADENLDPINAMPVMSGVPVRLEKHEAVQQRKRA